MISASFARNNRATKHEQQDVEEHGEDVGATRNSTTDNHPDCRILVPEDGMPTSITAIVRYMAELEPDRRWYDWQRDSRGE
jgi:hypothetical protein